MISKLMIIRWRDSFIQSLYDNSGLIVCFIDEVSMMM